MIKYKFLYVLLIGIPFTIQSMDQPKEASDLGTTPPMLAREASPPPRVSGSSPAHSPRAKDSTSIGQENKGTNLAGESCKKQTDFNLVSQEGINFVPEGASVKVDSSYQPNQVSLPDMTSERPQRIRESVEVNKFCAGVVYLANLCRNRPKAEPNVENGIINQAEREHLLPRVQERSKEQRILEEAKVKLRGLNHKLDGFTEVLNRFDRNLLKEEIEEVERMITTFKAGIEEVSRLSDDISKVTEVVQKVQLLEKQIGQLPKELKACEELEKLKKPVAELAQKIGVLIAEIAREQAGQVAPVAGDNQALIPAAQGVPVQAPVPVVNFSGASLGKTAELTKTMDEFKKGNTKIEQHQEANKKRRCCANCSSGFRKAIDLLVKYGIYWGITWLSKNPTISTFAEDSIANSINRNMYSPTRNITIWVKLPLAIILGYWIAVGLGYLETTLIEPYTGFSPGLAPICLLVGFRYLHSMLKDFTEEK